MSKKERAEKERAKVESYIPLDKSDLKHALEIPVKQIADSDIITIERQGKTKSPRTVKLKTRNITEEEEIETPVKKDYILIITEKPQAAEKIASALGKPRKLSIQQVPYYQLEKDGKKIIVACAVGHLFGLEQDKGQKGYPVFKISWTASFKKNPWAKKYYSVLKKLAVNAKEFIVATDYDVEGEVIGWNIIRFIAKQKDAKRMKFSTLTKDELENSYEHLLPTIDWGQAIAGETRHYLDWMYGINLSRALMDAIKSTGKFKIMSIGRVQGPALNLVVQKELEIQKFKPEPFWQVFIKLKNHEIELKYEKDISKKEELDKFNGLKGKEGMARTEKSKRNLPPPFPFDLTTLQREAYRLYKITPSRALQLAQSLYLAGLISYPRTSSQKIPEAIQPGKILENLAKKFKETKFATRTKPVEGGKSDPAHPSIFPTGEFGKIEGEEEKIYNLIVKRFISCFCEDAKIENKKIIFETENKGKNLRFLASGLGIIDKGWFNVYPATIKEVEIEDIEGKKIIESLRTEQKETQPPHRYTPASIITELEKRNLGTKATRAAIIETLYSRNYIRDTSIQATPLGISLISTMQKYSPVIIDEELTRDFEKDMNKLQTIKKDLEQQEKKVLEKAEVSLIKISDDFKKQKEKIGKELVNATNEFYQQERKDSEIAECPKCKEGKLRILYSKKFKRYFLACSAYPKCKTTFSLPPNGLIKKTEKTCEECNSPLLMRLTKGKRPWIFCFNPECPTRQKKEAKSESQESKEEKP